MLDGGTMLHLQGVREIFELSEGSSEEKPMAEKDEEDREGKIVVIGRGLVVEAWRRSLEGALR